MNLSLTSLFYFSIVVFICLLAFPLTPDVHPVFYVETLQEVVPTSECASDHLTKLDLERNLDHALLWNSMEEQAYDHFTSPKPQFDKKNQLTIPVVVHIVRDGNTGNVSDQAVVSAIARLNAAFANSGAYNQSSGVNTGIRFCLARQDPDGNPTNGINRIQSDLTNMDADDDDLALKNLSRWDPTCYMNIWVVNTISPGYAGYAYLPYLHGSNVDGVVVISNVFSGSSAHASTLIHECGHYLGLLHTFQGGCKNDDCLQEGDRVCDTPPDNSPSWLNCNEPHNSCTTDTRSGFLVDQNDDLSNFLDYVQHECRVNFTAGQSDRMKYFLTGIRESLLNCPGCLNPCPNPIAVEIIEPAELSLQLGEQLRLRTSVNNADRLQWFIDGEPAGSGTELIFTAEQSGITFIRLRGLSDDPNCLPQEDFVRIAVECPTYVTIEQPDGNIAVGEEIQLVAKYDDAFQGVEWQLENGQVIGTTDTLRHIFYEEGFQVIYLIAKSLNTGCGNTKKLYVTYAYCSGGDLEITSPTNWLVFGTELTTFTALNKYGRELSWYINDELISTADSFTYIFPDTGPFEIKLVGSPVGTNCEEAIVETSVNVLCWEGGRVSIREPFSFQDVFVGEPYLFGAIIVNLDLFEWFVDGEKVGEEEQLEYTFEEAGIHEVVMYGQNATYPCIQDRDTIEVLVEYDCYQRLFIQYESQRAQLFEPITYTAFSIGVKDIQWFVNGELVGEGDTLTYAFTDLGGYQLQLRGKSIYEACPDPNPSYLSIAVNCPTISARILIPDTVFVGEEFLVDTELQGPVQLEWSVHSPFNSFGTYIGSEPSFPFVLDDPFTYEFRLTAETANFSCGAAYDRRYVVALCEPSTVFAIEPAKDSIQLGEELHLKANIGEQIGQVYWRINGEVQETGKDFLFSSDEEGVKQIFLENHASVYGRYVCPRLKKKKVVTVYCPASVGIEPVPDTVDVGSSLVLEASTYNTSDVHWQINGQSQAQIGNTLTVDFDSMGLYEITVFSGSDFNNCLTDTVQIISSCPPEVIPISVENTTVGIGAEVVFSVPTQEWGSLIWYNNGQVIGTGASVVHVFDSSGAYEISVSNVGSSPVCGVGKGSILINSTCFIASNIFFDRYPFANEPFEVIAMVEEDWDSLKWYLNGQSLGIREPSFQFTAQEAGFYDFAVDIFYKGCVSRLHESDSYTEIKDRCQQEDQVGSYSLSKFGYAGRSFIESKYGGYYLMSGNGLMKLDQDLNILWSKVHDLDFIAVAESPLNGDLMVLAKLYGEEAQVSTFSHLLFKYSKEGILLWSKELQLNSLDEKINEKLLALPDGRFLLSSADDYAQEFSDCSLLNAEGETIWTKVLPGVVISDLALTEERTIIAVARTPNSKFVIVLKMDIYGELIWVKKWNSIDLPSPIPLHHLLGPVLTPLETGEIAVSWTHIASNGTSTAPVLILDKEGKIARAWEMKGQDLDGQIPLDLVSLPDGDLLMATLSNDTISENQYLYLTKMSATGTLKWQHKKNVNYDSYPRHIVPLVDGRIALFGADYDKTPYLSLLNKDGHPTACPYGRGEGVLIPIDVLEVPNQNYVADDASPDLVDYSEELPGSPFTGNPSLREECVSPGIPAPDFTVELTEASICENILSITLNACNIGNLGTQGYFPITFYPADPTKTDVEPFTIIHLAEEVGIPADTCLQVSFSTGVLTAAPTLFALINDDGARQLPLDLVAVSDHPEFTECSFLNNLDSIPINLNETAPLDLGEDISICAGDQLTLEANEEFETYEWQANIELPCTNCPVLTLQPSQSMEIELQVTTSAGCQSKDIIQIQVLESQLQEQMIEICQGDSAFVFGQWRQETGVFEQNFTASNGCDSTVQIDLVVYPPLEVQTEISPTCFGQASGEIKLNTGEDISTYDIRWSNGASGNVLSGLSARDYSYTITDNQGCQTQGNVVVPAFQAMAFDLDWQDPLCEGEATGSIVLTPLSEGLSFSLDGQNFQANGTFDQLASGDYKIWVRDQNGCEGNMPLQLVEPEPLLLEIPSNLSINQGDTISIVIGGQTDRITSIQWSPEEGLSCTDCLNPMASPNADIVYAVSIIDEQGCQVTTSVAIEVEVVSSTGDPNSEYNLDPPTAFSPNGDGINERFEILGLERFPKSSIVIVDRWGKVVFQADPYDNDWDGASLTGQRLPEATYYYILDLKRAKGKPVTGNIALIR